MMMRTSFLHATLLAMGLITYTNSFVPLSPYRTKILSSTLSVKNNCVDEFDVVVKKILHSTVGSLFIMSNIIMGINPASASDSRLIGEIPGSGIFFKDILNVESFDDPKVKGVTIYISNFERPLTERLQKDFFSDPSYASVTCAKTGPVSIADNIYTGKDGEEVFEESKSLLFKTLRVKRLYDKEKNTVAYVSFNTRLNKNDDANKSRFKSSICAVGLD